MSNHMRPNDPPHLVEAFRFEGLREIVGGEHEPEIVKFFAEAGHSWVKDDETAWCAAFVGAMLERSGVRSTRSLAARSYEKFGDPVDPPFDARRGDIAVFRRGTQAWQGHVAILLEILADGGVRVLGGNQSNAVNVSVYPAEKLICFRRVPGFRVNEELIEAVQRALRDKGYTEVGDPDGLMGTLTRGAIAAFKEDVGILPADGKITEKLLGQIQSAPRRAMSPTRQAGKPEGSRIVQSANGTAVIGGAGAAVGAGKVVVDAISPGDAIETISEVSGQVSDVKDALAPHEAFLGEFWPLLLMAACAVVVLLALRSRWARIEDHREGRTR